MPCTDHVMKIFVVDYRLNEECRHAGRVEKRMDADLTRLVIVRAEANAPALPALNPLSPADRQQRLALKINTANLFGQSLEGVERS